MDADRWRQLEQLYDAALEVDLPRRPEFLRAQCNGDESLCSAVESLLEVPVSVDSVFDHPAFEVAAKFLARDATTVRSNARIGSVVGHFRILEQIDGGGMGVVYRAEHLKLRSHVALKCLPDMLAHDPESTERLRREARAAFALNHPNICTIHDIVEHEGKLFIVMELIEGMSLRDRIAAGPLKIGEVLALGKDIASGLAAAHSKGIIHRDVKPANIFITADGRAKILDFGLAKVRPAQVKALAADSVAELSLTLPGATVGTLAYMSPEQARGEELDARTDLFSFGATLYEMSTRTRAFQGKSLAELHDALLNRQPRPAQEINPEIPAHVQKIIAKALEKDSLLRYQSAAEIRTDLERVRRGLAPAYDVDAPPSLNLTTRMVFLILAVLGLIAVATALVTGRAPLARYYNNRGVQLQQNGHLKEAIESYQRAVSLNSNYAEAHYNLGDAYEDLPAFDKAAQEYQLAIEADPAFYEPYNNLARLYIKRRKDYAAALELLDRAWSFTPKEHSVQYTLYKNYAWASFELHQFGQAKQNLNSAIALDDARGAAHCLLAKLLDAQGATDLSTTQWELCEAYSDQTEVEAEWRNEAQEHLRRERVR